MDPQWDDLKTVMHLVRARSLAGAADALGVNYTTVARRVGRVEKALGVLLFERLADGYRATSAGNMVARKASEMEANAFDMLRGLGAHETTLSGPLVVTAPQLLIAAALAPVLETFSARHPDVDLQIRATNDLLDLTRREADLAIRISNDPGDALKGLRLARQDNASFATQDWADRIAENPDTCIDWVVFSGLGQVPKAALERFPNSRVRMMFDDMAALVGAAQAGLGVVRMPMFLGRHTTGVVQVPVLPPHPYMDIWMVAHRDIWPSAKVAAFRDCLLPHFRSIRGHFVA